MKSTFIALLVLLISCSTILMAQGPVYLQGEHLEMVVSENGYYYEPGNPPAGFHPNDFNFGLVSDVNRTNWAPSGTFPDYCGDFIAPGSPVESFAVQIGAGVILTNASNDFNPPDIPGTITSSSNGPGQLRYAVWEGSGAGLDLRQTTVFFANRQYVFTVVDMCNNTSSDIGAIYYARNWDPDNDQAWGGGFLTEHQITSQPSFVSPYASVKSEGTTYGCYQETIAQDPRARASYGSFLIGVPFEMWAGLTPFVGINGSSRTADEANQMSYSLGFLSGGDCTCFSYVTVYQEVERSSAVARLPMACSAVAALLADPMSINPEDFMNPENLATERASDAPGQINVFPNPASQFASVDLTNFLDTEVTIRLVNVAGQTVYESRKVVTNSQQHLPVQDLPAGMYTLQVDSGNEIQSTRLVVN